MSPYTLNEIYSFLNSSDYKIIFEKLRFRSAVIDEWQTFNSTFLLTITNQDFTYNQWISIKLFRNVFCFFLSVVHGFGGFQQNILCSN